MPFAKPIVRTTLVRNAISPISAATLRSRIRENRWLETWRTDAGCQMSIGNILAAPAFSIHRIRPDKVQSRTSVRLRDVNPNTSDLSTSLVHDKTSPICGADLCLSVLAGLSAGYQGLRRHGWNRRLELRSLAVHTSASTGGNRLDLWFLDGPQLRCRGERSNPGESRHDIGRGRGGKNMCPANFEYISQRRMGHLSRVQEIDAR
jgi:hypothetical protein